MTVSLFEPMLGSTFPAPTIDMLSETEQMLVTGLSTKLAVQSNVMRIRQGYYDGLQRLQDLGVSIPPQLAGIRTVVDWPRICVDPLVQRTIIDGFRMPNAVDVDDELMEHWTANGLGSEFSLCALDAFTLGRGYIIVGSPDVDGDSPLVTVESPFNLALTWDPRLRKPRNAYQAYEVDGIFYAALYLPDQSIFMSRDSSTSDPWTIDNRDQHKLGDVCVTPFYNRPRSSDREGRSEITPAVMNTTDSACRSLLGMEIAREFYSVPHRYVLGATESDFQDPAGNAKSSIQMVMSKMLAFERDEEGNTPTVGQFQAYDPSIYTKIIDKHAQLMASYTQFPPSYFGQTADANPASADAIRVAHDGMDRRGMHAQLEFSTAAARVAQLMWRFAHGGQPLPAEMRRLETDWVEVSTPTPAATADSLLKMEQMGSITATSDVVLKKQGWSAVERMRLVADREKDEGASVLAELATSLQTKQIRAINAVDTAIKPPTEPTPAAGPPLPPEPNVSGK